MAAKYVVLALAAICIAQASAASIDRRSAEGGNTIEQVIENAMALLEELSEEVTEYVVPSFSEMRALMQRLTKKMEERKKSVLDDDKRQMETQGSDLSERANAALQEDTVQLNESLNKTKRSAPEVQFFPCYPWHR
ncbi:uncharacterized protein LOC124156208 isoform X3 [Ischnura elegans]|uniref:uncharacterized protein LOC124156208 isoform X3 n=1 Tax=Ischnura elegans TaxID=197161 RepID=UPI001ED86C41|nr:uncharacterized protein LOC124156208 isoform X3 [Ischnura elegans]